MLPEANPATKHLNKNKEDYWCINSLNRVWKEGRVLIPRSLSFWRESRIQSFCYSYPEYCFLSSLRASCPGGRSGGGAGKERRACNYVFGIWIPPPIPLWLPVDWAVRFPPISANVNKHWKTCAKGNDAITSVISANQHFASIFSMQKRSCKFFFLFPPRRQSAPESLLASEPKFRLPQSRVAVKLRIQITFSELRTVFWSNPGSRAYHSRTREGSCPWQSKKITNLKIFWARFLPPYRVWSRARAHFPNSG